MKNLIQSTTQLALHIALPYIKEGLPVIDATCGNGHDTFALAKAIWPINNSQSSCRITCDNGSDNYAQAGDNGPIGDQTGDNVSGEDSQTGSRLLAFDIQQDAIDATRKLLESEGFVPALEDGKIRLINDSHENMAEYLAGTSQSKVTGQAGQAGVVDADHAMQTQSAGTSRPCLILFNLGYLPGGDKGVTTNAEATLNAVQAAVDLLAVNGLVSITMYSGHEEGAKEKAQLLAFAKSLDSKVYHVAYVNLANQPNNPPELLLISRKR